MNYAKAATRKIAIGKICDHRVLVSSNEAAREGEALYYPNRGSVAFNLDVSTILGAIQSVGDVRSIGDICDVRLAKTASLDYRVLIVAGKFPGFGGTLHNRPSTAEKLSAFDKLKAGWCNGIGQPISAAVIALAKILLDHIEHSGFNETDTFPRPDGGVTLAVYFSDGSDLALNLNLDGSVDIDSEQDAEFGPFENLPFSDVIGFFSHFSFSWNLSTFLTSHATMQDLGASGAKALKARVMAAASRSSTKTASLELPSLSASTRDASTRR